MTGPIAPVEVSVTVDADARTAFEVFTEGMGSWWPMLTHSVGEARVVDVVVDPIEGGQVLEVWDDGTRVPWADVLVWDPPRRFAIAWNAGGYGDRAGTHVDVAFVEADGRTTVSLVHSGWEAWGGAAADSRADYAEGWVLVLGRYVTRVTA